LWKGRAKPGDDLAGDELPPQVLAEERARAAKASRTAGPEAAGEPPEGPAAGSSAGVTEVAEVAEVTEVAEVDNVTAPSGQEDEPVAVTPPPPAEGGSS
jgi:hypothetical protein